LKKKREDTSTTASAGLFELIARWETRRGIRLSHFVGYREV
jgi:hypothetical protein